MEDITLADLRIRMRTSSLVLFEALPEAHFAAGHLPGAFAMPLDRVEKVASRVAPDKEQPVVVYCASSTCRNSHLAAEKLELLGYRSVRVFCGGKAEWKDAGLALEVEKAIPSTV
jgi:rhodanese-related sulfurtransferase